MLRFKSFIWKSVPVLRLLLPLITGILLQFYFEFDSKIIVSIFLLSIISFSALNFLSTSLQYVYSWIIGCSINLLFISMGAGLVHKKMAVHDEQFALNHNSFNYYVVATIQEPLVEKEKSFKALASIEIVTNNQIRDANSNILLYFKKGKQKPLLKYGSKIIIKKSLQPIINSGNPGAFNYKQYSAFQNIFYQGFLTENDFQILSSENKSLFDDFLLKARTKILSSLRLNIKNNDALSIAEALLIGYRDDLDKDLVQAYSNTGVVHIIAISGLHIAMIYGLILFFFKLFKQTTTIKWIKPFVVLIVIWGFTFIAGAMPSILRSAIMFSFIVLGESFSKRTNIYNNLAASAFVILLFNPFSLWDVGFQLSYAAVLSIVIFSKHINNWIYFTNKGLKYIWELCSVTLSAQVLTLPLILFYFHQFPGLFLFTNLIAVPLSGLILYVELLLLVVTPFVKMAAIMGNATSIVIGWMNAFIVEINNVPHSSWQCIQISILQTILLYLTIAGISIWLLRKQNRALIFSLGFFLVFFIIRSFDFIGKENQQKLIVYNVPQHEAMDIVEGRNYQFVGDSILLQDAFLQNFHLKPSRILNRISATNEFLTIVFQNKLIQSSNRKIFLIDKAIKFSFVDKRIKVDAIVISKNPKLDMNQMVKEFDCDEYIFDASNPLWKINQWKKDCENLHLRHHSIPEQGAFVMEL